MSNVQFYDAAGKPLTRAEAEYNAQSNGYQTRIAVKVPAPAAYAEDNAAFWAAIHASPELAPILAAGRAANERAIVDLQRQMATMEAAHQATVPQQPSMTTAERRNHLLTLTPWGRKCLAQQARTK